MHADHRAKAGPRHHREGRVGPRAALPRARWRHRPAARPQVGQQPDRACRRRDGRQPAGRADGA